MLHNFCCGLRYENCIVAQFALSFLKLQAVLLCDLMVCFCALFSCDLCKLILEVTNGFVREMIRCSTALVLTFGFHIICISFFHYKPRKGQINLFPNNKLTERIVKVFSDANKLSFFEIIIVESEFSVPFAELLAIPVSNIHQYFEEQRNGRFFNLHITR